MRSAAKLGAMAELIHKQMTTVRDESGRHFDAAVYGQPRDDGYWEGWLEFAELGGDQEARTPSETVQASRANLLSWALGLEPAYLEGAFQRARAHIVREAPRHTHSGRSLA
jgi:hypothetical protein